jgi:hypothetical protein
MSLERLEELGEIASSFDHDTFTLFLSLSPLEMRALARRVGADPDEFFQSALDAELGEVEPEEWGCPTTTREDLEAIWDAVQTQADWDLLQAWGELALEGFISEAGPGGSVSRLD